MCRWRQVLGGKETGADQNKARPRQEPGAASEWEPPRQSWTGCATALGREEIPLQWGPTRLWLSVFSPALEQGTAMLWQMILFNLHV